MTDKTSPVRHAVARATGSTTWTRKDGDEWKIDCLNHGAAATAPNRGAAWKVGSHPQDFCPKCKSIAAGKLEKIIDGRLDIPAPTTTSKKAASKVSPVKGQPVAKKTAARKPKTMTAKKAS